MFLFQTLPVPLPLLQWLYRVHRLQLVSPSPSCSIVFSVLYQCLGTYLAFRFPSVLLSAKSTIRQDLCFLLTITRSGRLAEIRWSVCILIFQRTLWFSFSRTDSGLSICHLFPWSNLNYLHCSQWITFPTQSCLLLYYFCCIHLLCDWSFHLHHLTINIYYFVVLPIFALI